MIYHFIQYFDTYHCSYLSDEKKLEIAKQRAAEDLAKKLLENVHFEIDMCGNVTGYINVGELS